MHLKEAFRIDLDRRETIGQRLDQKKLELLSGKVGTGDVEAGSATHSSTEDDGKTKAAVDEKIDFVIALCLAMLASGDCTVDAEERTTNAAIALGLKAPTLDIGPRCMHASFEDIKYSFLGTNRDIVLYKLQDVVELATHVAKEGESYKKEDIEVARALLDDMMKEPSPYGWFIQDLCYIMISTFAAVVAFNGSYWDMLVACIISCFILAIKKLAKKFPIVVGPLVTVLVSAMSGLLAAAAYRILLSNGIEEPVCNIPAMFLSPLIVFLPCGELIYGGYEVLMGHFVVGSTRLLSAIVRCMVLAIGLTIGWQITGYNLMQNEVYDGVTASFVPSHTCTDPFSQPQNVGPWWKVYVLWNLPMLVGVMGGLQVRPADVPAQYIVAYVSFLAYAAMIFAGPEGNGAGMTEFLVMLITLFLATNLSAMVEFFTGVPAVPSIIPVLLLMTPAEYAVLEFLLVMQESAHVQGAKTSTDVISYLLLKAVSFSLGMYIALAYWKPILLRKEIAPGAHKKAKAVYCTELDHVMQKEL